MATPSTLTTEDDRFVKFPDALLPRKASVTAEGVAIPILLMVVCDPSLSLLFEIPPELPCQSN